jgi:anti-sigma regulatory factor (Ser/Thr protein kinase)/PAS domain-containing protein
MGLVIASGFVGLFSLNQTRFNTQWNVEAVDMARSAQIELEKQYNSWKSVVYEGGNFALYQKYFLEYSQHMAKVQDYLSNIKIIYESKKDIYPRLNELYEIHKKMNQQYVDALVLFESADKKERDKTVAVLQDSDQKVISMMETIVDLIRKDSESEIQQINNRYFSIMLVSIIILIAVTLSMGVWIARGIIKSHAILSGLVEEKTRDLVFAHRELSVSEEKYRLLVEGTNEMIFSLDKDLKFLKSNKAVKPYLRYSAAEIKGKSFLDMIFEDNGNALSKHLIHEKISHLIQSKQPASFNVVFKSPRNIEQKEMKVRLEYLDVEGTFEILGRAEDLAEDAIVKFNTYEHAVFEIENYLLLAEDMAFRLSDHLNKYINHSEVSVMRIALREILINAIEHGNLGISFEEKTNAIVEDTYFSLIEKRRADPQYGSRKVSIEYVIDGDRAAYKITDQGDGFDVEKHHLRVAQADEQLLAHGRGILMTKNAFDEVIYNKKGNQVVLVKKFGRAS